MLATVLPRLTRLPYAAPAQVRAAVTARPARNRLRTWEKMAGPATDFRCGPLVPLGRFALSPSLNVDQAFCGIEGKATRPTSRVLPEPSSHSSCLEPSTNYTFLAAQGRLQRAGVVKGGVPQRMKGGHGKVAGINQRTGTQGRSEGVEGSSESE